MTDTSSSATPQLPETDEFSSSPALPATDTTTEAPTRKRPSMIREVIETLVLAAVIFVLVRAVVLNFKVDGHSMDPSFDNGELLLVNRNAYLDLGDFWLTEWIPGIDDDTYLFHAPQRGDVIVFTPPIENNDKPFIKRIIGLPGDTVETRDGKVYVNGVQLDEPYIDGKQSLCNSNTVDCAPYVVPEGQVFVMGDNRTNSEDSRVFGGVPIGNIIGKAWVTYWPTDDIGVVPHYDYPDVP